MGILGRPERPITNRERWYVAQVWGHYSTRHIRRYLRGGNARLYRIVRLLRLPALPLGPRSLERFREQRAA